VLGVLVSITHDRASPVERLLDHLFQSIKLCFRERCQVKGHLLQVWLLGDDEVDVLTRLTRP